MSTRTSKQSSKSANELIKSAWRQSRLGLLVIGIFSIFINLFRLVTPIYVLQILDRIPASRSVETLVMLTVITVAAVGTGVLLELIRRRMFLHWGSWIERSFGPTLVQGSLNVAGHGDSTTPSRVLRDLATIRSFVSGHAILAWLDIIWAPAFILVAYLINPLLAGIALSGVLVVFVLGILNEVLTRSSRDAALRASTDSKELVAAAERSGETIGPLRMAENVTERWSEATFERLDENLRSRRITITISAAIRFCGRCLRVALLAVGLWLVIGDVMTLGGVIAAGFLGRMAFQAVKDAMLRWRELTNARRAYSRICSAFSSVSRDSVSMHDHALPATLKISNLGYRYPNQQASILKRIDIDLDPGSILCVIGPSASGKTTFSRLAIGRLKPRYGSVRLGDIDISRLRQDGPQRYVGYLPQEIRLFRGTARENIAHMAKGDFGQVVEAAQLAGAHEAILSLPYGYDTELDDEHMTLSAGQRKSIALARAFYGWPQLIVMDEPEPHLDRSARRVMNRALKDCAAQGSIIIVTSQSKSLSRIADKVLALDEGTIRLLETREDIESLRRSRSRRSVRMRA
ncbi:MAG: ATP-binding cassette domain-containing protein [Pseudomonadota bacterium]